MDLKHCSNFSNCQNHLVTMQIRIQIQGFDDQNWKTLKAEKRNYFSLHLRKSYIRSLHPLQNIQYFKTSNFLPFFYFGVFLPVLWNRNYFLRFRFRFRLLKSYGSGSDFWKSYGSSSGSGSGSGSYFRKVPVPVPAPYKDNKKQIFQQKFWNFFSFVHRKLF